MKFLIFCFAVVAVATAEEVQRKPSIHEKMMRYTCKIFVPPYTGTGFIVGKPSKDDPAQLRCVLITAAHVFSESKADTATISFRKRKDEDHWTRVDGSLKIRDGQTPLWKKHPEVDLAVIYLPISKDLFPDGIPPMSNLVTDDQIRRWEIGPGTELLCLGYPHGEESNQQSSPEGFPLLRSGKIASYPILPTKERKTFYFDFSIYPGNSGGPVYIHQALSILQNPVPGESVAGIVGLITGQLDVTEKLGGVYEKRETKHSLALGVVIPATFITELIESLPEPGSSLPSPVETKGAPAGSAVPYPK